MAAQVSPAAHVAESGHSLGLWARLRRGTPWWAQPVTIVAVLVAFAGYSIWTSFFGPGPITSASTPTTCRRSTRR